MMNLISLMQNNTLFLYVVLSFAVFEFLRIASCVIGMFYNYTDNKSEDNTQKPLIYDFTRKMKRYSLKIHKDDNFDEIYRDFKSYNKSKKEGKKFTYNYRIISAVKIITSEFREYYVITGNYYKKKLSFCFGTDEYYEDNNYGGVVIYNGTPMTVDEFINHKKFKFINKTILCHILNLYYSKFYGFNIYWH